MLRNEVCTLINIKIKISFRKSYLNSIVFKNLEVASPSHKYLPKDIFENSRIIFCDVILFLYFFFQFEK